MPKADMLPMYETDRTETPTPVNPLGVKGAGETGTIASTPAVVNAVVDALSGLGIDHIEAMPLTPERVWKTVQAAKSQEVRETPTCTQPSSSITRPARVKEALDLLGSYKDDAKLLAGGHSLLPVMKLRLAQPKHLIDLAQGRRARRHQGGRRHARHRRDDHPLGQVESLGGASRRSARSSPRSRRSIGDPMVRNMGTIGGSLAHADPAAD